MNLLAIIMKFYFLYHEKISDIGIKNLGIALSKLTKLNYLNLHSAAIF